MLGRAAQSALPPRRGLPRAAEDLGGESSPPLALGGQQGAEHGAVCDPSVPFSPPPPQEEPWEPGCSAGSKELNTAVIFLAYQRLLQGKLRFFFHDLAKDLCDRGQGGGRDPPQRGLN